MSDQNLNRWRNLLVAALVDGTLADEETAFLEELRLRLKISQDVAQREATTIMHRSGNRTFAIASDGERHQLLHDMTRLFLSDGVVSDEEMRCLVSIASRLDIGEEQVRKMIADCSGAVATGETTFTVRKVKDGRTLERVRFGPERDLLAELSERFNVDAIVKQFEDAGGASQRYNSFLVSNLRLTPNIAPELYSLLDEVKCSLGFTDSVDLFVSQQPMINAIAIGSQASDVPHIIGFTSFLIERMTQNEIRFVIGHELGHIKYGHNRAKLVYSAVGQDEDGNLQMSGLLERRLECWGRLAELSADRAGFIAAGGNLQDVVSSFFKLEGGLGPEHLKFDISAFLSQLASIQKIERKNLVSTFSHPVTPIRVRALQLFAEAGADAAAPEKLSGVDAQVSDIARLMDYETTDPLGIQALDFLIAGGLLVAKADGEMSQDEYSVLIQYLLQFCSDPEAELGKIESEEQAKAQLESAGTWLRENAGEEKYILLRELAHIAAVDGIMADNERAVLMTCALKMGIPEKSATDTVNRTMAERLQVRYNAEAR